MDGENQPANSVKKVFRKTVKVFSVILVVLAGIGMAGYLVLEAYLDGFLKKKLEQAVHQKWDGLYTLRIGSLHVNLSGLSIRTEGVQLTTDTAQYNSLPEGKKKPPILHLVVPGARITDVNVWPLLWGKGIHIEEIVVNAPEIAATVQGSGGKEQQSHEALLKSLQEKVSGYVNWVTVDSLRVKRGKLRYESNQPAGRMVYQTDNFSLTLRDALIDEEALGDKNRILFTKNIILEVNDSLRISSPDHRLTIGHVRASTAGGTVIRGVRLTTDSTLISDPGNYIHLTVPVITAGYLDWRKLYDEKGLYSPHIHLRQPRVVVITGGSGKQQRRPLHQQVAQYVPWLRLDSVTVEEGDFTFMRQDKEVPSRYHAGNVTLALHDVLINETAARDTTRLLYTKAFRAEVADTLSLRQNGLEGFATYLLLASGSGLRLGNLHFSSPAASGSLDSLHVQFTGWGKLLDHQGLRIPQIRLERPVVRVVQKSKGGKTNPSATGSRPAGGAGVLTLHQPVEKFVPWLRIDQLLVSNGKVQYVGGGASGNRVMTAAGLALSVKGILLDSAAARDPSRVLYAKSMQLAVEYYLSYQDGSRLLRLGSLRASTGKGVTIRNASLSGGAPADTSSGLQYRVTVPRVQVNFTDWSSLTGTGGVVVPAVAVSSPQAIVRGSVTGGKSGPPEKSGKRGISLPALHQMLPAGMPWLRVDTLYLYDGQVAWHKEKGTGEKTASGKGITFAAGNVRIDEKAFNAEDRFWYAGSMRLAVKDSLWYSGDTYQAGAGNLRVSTGEGIRLQHFSFFPQEVPAADTVTRVALVLPALDVNFTEWNDLLHYRGVSIPAVQVENPAFTLKMARSRDTTSRQQKQQQKGLELTLHKQLQAWVPWLSVQSLEVNKASIRVDQAGDKGPFPVLVQPLTLVMDDILIDSAAAGDPDRTLYTKDIRLHTPGFGTMLKDSLYAFGVGEITASTRDKYLRIEGIRLDPRYQLPEFYQRAGGQQDIYSGVVDKFELTGLEFKQMVRRQRLIAQHVQVDSFAFGIMRDRNYPKAGNKPLEFPQEVFRNMDTYVRIDSIRFADGYVGYTEVADNGTNPGTLFFEQLSAGITNFTNDSTLTSVQNPVVVVADALLMGEGPMQATLEIPVHDPKNAFKLRAGLWEMKLTELNPALESMSVIRVDRGRLDEMVMQVDADLYGASGNMCAFYRNLRLQIQDGQPGRDGTVFTRIASFLANRLVINDTNYPGKGFNPGTIQIERRENQAFLNYLWATIRSGMYSSVGYSKAKKIIPFL